MPTDIKSPAPTAPTGRMLTGWKVLAIFVGFFVVYMTANSIMVYFASTTFRGLDGDRPYEAGLAYNRELEAAREQEKLGWKVDAGFEKDAAGPRIVVRPRDASGKGLTGLGVKVYFAHPSDRSRDIRLDLAETGQGIYAAPAKLSAGGWDVNLELRRGDGAVWRSKNRITVE